MARAHRLPPAPAPDEVGKATEYFTHENVERYLAAAEEQGIEELGVSEHIYRFKEALELWGHPYWHRPGGGRPRRLLRVRANDAAAARESRPTSSAGPRTGSPSLLDGHDFDYVVGSIHFLGERGAVDDRRYDVWDSFPDADSLWSDLLRVAGRAGPLGPLRHRLPPRPDQDLGRRPARRRSVTRASTTSRFVEALAESEIAVEISTAGTAQARRRDLSGAGARRDVPGGGRRVRPLLGRPRTGPGRVRIRRGDRVPRAARRRADLRLRAAPARRLEPIGRTGVEPDELADREEAG